MCNVWKIITTQYDGNLKRKSRFFCFHLREGEKREHSTITLRLLIYFFIHIRHNAGLLFFTIIYLFFKRKIDFEIVMFGEKFQPRVFFFLLIFFYTI
jgi:hypothetical protein